jgi:hypothetical protein
VRGGRSADGGWRVDVRGGARLARARATGGGQRRRRRWENWMGKREGGPHIPRGRARGGGERMAARAIMAERGRRGVEREKRASGV